MAESSEINNILVLDCETTGLPITKGFDKYYPVTQTKFYDRSRVIEIAYIIYSANSKKIKHVSSLIKPIDFTIDNTHIHGISNDIANREGIDISNALINLYNDLKNTDTIIAHNINFDINVISAECYRQKLGYIADSISAKKKECTMKVGQKFMNVYKYPKLIELYEYLFNRSIIQEHRALSDVKYCAQCYFEMNKNRI